MADSLLLGLWQNISENIDVAIPIVFKTGVPVSHTGDTNETALYTQAIPALSANSCMEIRFGVHTLLGGGNITVRLRLNGTALWEETFSGGIGVTLATVDRTIWNRGSTNSQVELFASTTFSSYTAAALVGVAPTFAIETNAGTLLTITGELANAGDTVVFDAARIIIWP